MVDASTRGSIMTMNMDDAYEIYEIITENQSMWLNDKKVQRKTFGMHNVDVVTVLATRGGNNKKSLTLFIL